MNDKHPLHDLFKQEKLVMDALIMAQNTKPVQMEIINGVAHPVIQEPTEYELALQYQLEFINDKKRQYELLERKSHEHHR